MGTTGTTRKDRGHRAGELGGFSQLDILIGIVLLVVAAVAFSRAVVNMTRLSQRNRETSFASDAAQRRIEVMQTQTFSDIFALYNDDPADDPGGAGTGPGGTFAVAGLEPREGDPDGFVGETWFPSIGLWPGQLREDAVNAYLGMPRDLSGDGAIDGLDHAADYVLLPVIVRVRWTSAAGEGLLQYKTVMANR